MSDRAAIATWVLGPPQHGVVSFAESTAASMASHLPSAPIVFDPVVSGHSQPAADLVHLHFTDQLFGSRCDLAADAFCALSRRFGHAGSRISVTLHDVPQPADDPGRYARRSAAYRAVVEAVDGRVIVSSQHEATQLMAFAACRPVVVELPLERHALDGPAAPPSPDVHIAGFVYPGKGHLEAIDALDALPAGVGLTALGRPADGHEQLVDELTERAATRGRRFTVTGYLPEPMLRARIRAAAIPLSAHRLVSASGSIGDWLSSGRRPLVADSPYARELELRCPGSIHRYPPTGLAEALAEAVADPASTWLADGVRLGPSRDEVGRRYAEALRGFAR